MTCKHCHQPITRLTYQGKPDWIHDHGYFGCIGLYSHAEPEGHGDDLLREVLGETSLPTL